MKKWSSHWRASTQPRKQRKYRINAPLHVRHKMLSAHLSKELRLQYKRRSFPLRVGDEVRVAVGEHAGKTGKVTKVDLSSLKVYIGIKRKKVSGQEVEIPFDPSNLIITKLNLEDKKRERALRKLKKVNKDGKA